MNLVAAEIIATGGLCECRHAALMHTRAVVRWWFFVHYEGCDVLDCSCNRFRYSAVKTRRFQQEQAFGQFLREQQR
jgi:transposase